MLLQFVKQQQDIQAQKNIAEQSQAKAIQSNVSQDTWNMLRQFGQRAAWTTASGGTAGMSPPMTTTAGGFANPIANPMAGPIINPIYGSGARMAGGS
jgi:hypothetical protein